MKRKLVIDADHLLYAVAGQTVKDSLEGETLEAPVDLEMLKRKFHRLVKEIEDEVALETVSKKFKLGKTILVFSDPEGNFRFDLYPDYKKSRRGQQKSAAFYKLRDWAIFFGKMVKGTEADDVVAWYVREGAVGVSTDKDLLKGVKGRWFDAYHSRRSYEKVKGKDAARFTLLQTLAGDATDNIIGIPRVGMKTAENLLISNGATWEGVVKSYENAGLTKEDAILNRRLIGMDQYNGKEIVLWKS